MSAAVDTASQGALAAAQRAWRERARAQGELSRLSRYTRMTPGMKDDRARHAEALHRAERELARILGGVA